MAPEGVEMFFDNVKFVFPIWKCSFIILLSFKVGGDYYHTIINKHMKRYGRASLCGSIENYNDATPKLCKYYSIFFRISFFEFFKII